MKIDERSVLKHTAQEISRSQFFEVIAVTGFEKELVTAELAGLPVEIIHNNNFETGMHSSIKAGLKKLSPEADFFAVCLADQPLLNHADYNHLIDMVAENPDYQLFRPMFNGKFGNPAIISRKYIPEIMEYPESDKGCAYLFERHPEATLKVTMSNQSTLVDVDTHDLFEEVRFHLQKRD